MLSVQLLGVVSARRDGRPVPIGSKKQRLLLAVLASTRGTVSRSRLIDALWPDDPPPSAVASLMAYVSRLRGAIGAQALVSEVAGYRLAPDHLDAEEFELAVSAPRATAGELERALSLWQGDAFGDLSDHPELLAHATRLNVLHQEARVRLAEAYLDEGDALRSTALLEAVLAADPLREDAWALLVRALLEAGRSAEAVLAANRGRRGLAEVGLDPGPALAQAQADALRSGTAAGDQPPSAARSLRYARNGGVHLAFQVVGAGPTDVVLSSYGSVSIDAIWDEERFRSFVLKLASSSRVVLYDTRGIGFSDPIDVADPPTLEEQSEDLRRVVATAGAGRPVIVGVGDGGPTAIAYAHRYPAGLSGLVLVNTFARLLHADDYPHGVRVDQFTDAVTRSVDTESRRDTRDVLRNHAPSVASDAGFRAWWERAGRRGASPATASALWRVRYGADVRPLLAELEVPTLVLHRRRSRIVALAHGAYLAQRIPRARLVELDGADQSPFTQDGARVAALIAAFAADVARTGPRSS